MGLLQYVSVDEICARGSIKDSDILKLRRAFNEDATISTAEADALFDINDACAIQDAAWAGFFIEAITDYIVNQARPEGYIVADNAGWLIGRISADGRIDSRTELDLLVRVLDKARWSPPSLVQFALQQVKLAVLSGKGPLRGADTLEAGMISAAEVHLLRRILFAFGGDGSIAVTRVEADVLIDINDVLSPGRTSPEFTALFIKGVANAVMHGIGLAVPAREEALRDEQRHIEADMRGAGTLLIDGFTGGGAGASARARVGGFLGRMVQGANVWGTYRLQSSEEQALSRLERQRLEIITNEKLDDADAHWLAGRLGANGILNENEQALLRFLREESPVLPPALQRLADRIGHVA